MIKATTTLLTLMLIASFAGTVIGAQTMVGSAVAQGERGSENACRDMQGATLVRGECTAPAVQGQPTCNPQTVGGVPATYNQGIDACDAYTFGDSANGQFVQACNDISGSRLLTYNGGSLISYDCIFPATPGELTCPTGGELVGNQCVSRPGQGRG